LRAGEAFEMSMEVRGDVLGSAGFCAKRVYPVSGGVSHQYHVFLSVFCALRLGRRMCVLQYWAGAVPAVVPLVPLGSGVSGG